MFFNKKNTVFLILAAFLYLQAEPFCCSVALLLLFFKNILHFYSTHVQQEEAAA